ncbi:MAG: glycosyltransferase [Eggerthellaceae bacterium]|nr:glycosyltransferase [Eggerthellaceae bacterium]
MEPKISVIMPVFNAEDHLDSAIHSFESQSISSQCELICINDGSTDTSPDILKEWKAKLGNRVTVFTQENQGAGLARNVGLDNARGEFVAFLDSDDEYPSVHTLESMYSKATEYGMAIVGGTIERIRPDGRYRNDPKGKFAHYYRGQGFEKDALIRYSDWQFDYGFYRFIYKRDLLDSNHIRFPDLLRYQDPPFFVQAMIAACEFYALREMTYSYRVDVAHVIWDYRKGSDALAGIVAVADLAKEHGFQKLYDNCVHRLCGEMGPRLRDYALREENADLLYRIVETRNQLAKIGDEMNMPRDVRFSKMLSPEPVFSALLKGKALGPMSWKIARAAVVTPRKIKRMVKRGKNLLGAKSAAEP